MLFNSIKITKSNLLTFLLVIFVLLLVFSQWYESGFIISTAEEGIPFYNTQLTYQKINNFWIENGLGSVSALYSARLPFYFLVSQVSQLGVGESYIQAILFGLLLLTPLIYIPKLTSLILKNENLFIGYSAALLYLFNFYTASQVFHRFVYPLMFAWSFLPLFLYLYIAWIQTQRRKYLFYFVLANLVFSYTYSLPSSIIVLWTPAYLYSIYLFADKKNSRLIKRTIIITLFWLVTSIWWLYPLLVIGGQQVGSSFSEDNSLLSLQQVSKYFPNEDILLLKQSYYFENNTYFKALSESPRVVVATYILLFLTLFGFLYSLFKKRYAYLSILIVISWFISKGVNPPLGNNFYEFLFSNFSFTRVLRNSYEKFGVVYLLAYVILASIAIYVLFNRFRWKRLGLFISTAVILYIILTIGRPIYRGEVFLRHAYISVPDYYSQANHVINSNTTGRVLHLPYHKFPAIKYTWGYEGEEASRYLFDRSNIAGLNSYQGTEDILSVLPSYFSNKNFTKILKLLNVGAIVIHEDLERDVYYDYWVDESIKIAEDWIEVQKLEKVGKLTIYKNNSLARNQMVTLANEVVVTEDINSGFETILSDDFDEENQAVFVQSQNTFETKPFKYSNIPIYDFHKNDSRSYSITIKDATEPFVIILSNGFDRLWQAAIDGDVLENHFEVNGYANGWFVDKTGSYNIMIEYKVWPWD